MCHQIFYKIRNNQVRDSRGWVTSMPVRAKNSVRTEGEELFAGKGRFAKQGIASCRVTPVDQRRTKYDRILI